VEENQPRAEFCFLVQKENGISRSRSFRSVATRIAAG